MARPYNYTVISDQLIIKACNTPGGSGGVLRWNRRVAARAVRILRATAPEGNPANHAADGNQLSRREPYIPGCYRRGFDHRNYGGGTGHRTQSVIYNSCDHARYVELGRGPSHGEEWFTWSRVRGGRQVLKTDSGTHGFRGRRFLYPTVKATLTANGMKHTALLSTPLKRF